MVNNNELKNWLKTVKEDDRGKTKREQQKKKKKDLIIVVVVVGGWVEFNYRQVEL